MLFLCLFYFYQNARIEDGGTYTCFAENRYGKASATGDLIVRRELLLD